MAVQVKRAKRLQILVDLDNMKRLNPDKHLTVKTYALNKDMEVWVRYDHVTQRVQAIEVTRGLPHLVRNESTWTDDYKEIEQWLGIMGLEVQVYRKQGKTKTVWAYIDGRKTWDVVQMALSVKVMLPEMKARIKKHYPDVEFKVEV